MPKSIIVNPSEVFQSETLKIKDIPINQYKADFKKEKKEFGDDGRMRASDFRDRVVDVLEELFRFTLLVRSRSAVLTARHSEQKQLRDQGQLKPGLGVATSSSDP